MHTFLLAFAQSKQVAKKQANSQPPEASFLLAPRGELCPLGVNFVLGLRFSQGEVGHGVKFFPVLSWSQG
jgi:hypothetical protein